MDVVVYVRTELNEVGRNGGAEGETYIKRKIIQNKVKTMSNSINEEFLKLPDIECFINILVRLQLLCFKERLTENSVITSGIKLVDGYVTKQKDTTVFATPDKVQQFRDWVASRVFETVIKG